MSSYLAEALTLGSWADPLGGAARPRSELPRLDCNQQPCDSQLGPGLSATVHTRTSEGYVGVGNDRRTPMGRRQLPPLRS